MQNKAGKFVEPTIASGQAALASAKMPEDLVVWVSDPEGDDAYPIVTYTWIMTYKKYADAEEGRGAEGRADLLPDGRPEGQRGAGLYPLAQRGGGSSQGGAGNIGAEAAEKKSSDLVASRPLRSDDPIGVPKGDTRGSSDGRTGFDLPAAHPLGEVLSTWVFAA